MTSSVVATPPTTYVMPMSDPRSAIVIVLSPVVICAPLAGVPVQPLIPVNDAEVVPAYAHVPVTPAPEIRNVPAVAKPVVDATVSAVWPTSSVCPAPLTVVLLLTAGACHVNVSPAASFFVAKPVKLMPSTELEPIVVGALSVSLPAPVMLAKPLKSRPSTLPARVPVIVQLDAPVATCAPSAGVP